MPFFKVIILMRLSQFPVFMIIAFVQLICLAANRSKHYIFNQYRDRQFQIVDLDWYVTAPLQVSTRALSKNYFNKSPEYFLAGLTQLLRYEQSRTIVGGMAKINVARAGKVIRDMEELRNSGTNECSNHTNVFHSVVHILMQILFIEKRSLYYNRSKTMRTQEYVPIRVLYASLFSWHCAQ